MADLFIKRSDSAVNIERMDGYYGAAVLRKR